MPEMKSATVAHVSLDDPLAPIEVGGAHDQVLLVVGLGGVVLGEVVVPARDGLGVVEQQEAISRELADPIWRARLAADFTRAARRLEPASAPTVSVVVCATGPADCLPELLHSLAELDPPAHEVLVVGSDESVRALCEDHGVRCLEERAPGLSRARNRGVAEATGDVVAFLEPGWIADVRWLDGLGRAFEDRLVMAVKGYTGPLELQSGEQLLLERNPRGLQAKTYDRIVLQVPRLPEGNCFFRREAFARVGPFAEFLGPGTATRAGHESEYHHRLVAAGWRVAFEPSHIAWRRPPRNLLSAAYAEGLGKAAHTTYSLLARRDLSVLPTPRSRSRSRLPLVLRLTRTLGKLAGPWALLASRLAHRGLPPVEGRPPTPDDTQRAAGSRQPAVVAEGPPLSVAIASYNRREPLAHLLETFAQQSYPPDRFEVVVVVDGSTDGTAERARALDLPYRLRVLEQENRGLAASRNRGAHEAANPVIVFIDDDMAPARDFLAEHAGAHARASRPVAALGTCPPANPGDDLASLALRHWWEDYYRRRSEPDHQWAYTDFGDGNMSLPRSILEASGGWDEEFAKETVRRQDWELAIRLLESGVRFVDCPGAKAWHHFEVSLATSMRNRRVEGRADVLLGLKHPHVREHLFLRRYIVDERGRQRQYSLFADHPAAGRRLIEVGARTAQLLEKVQLRWVAWKSMLRMLSYSYLIGVRETLQTEDRFEEFVAPMLRHELVETVPLGLDQPGPLELDPAIGAIDLLLRYAGRDLARVDALEPEVQWDWDTLTERVVRDALEPYRAAVGEAVPLTPAAAPSP